MKGCGMEGQGAPEVEFRVLGAPEVRLDGATVPLPAAKVRTFLAALMVRGGQPASHESLLDDLWTQGPPRSAAANLRTYATQLRRVLPCGRLVTVGSGYQLTSTPEELDLARARQCAAQGREALARGDVHAAAGWFTAAHREWHGRPLDGLVLGPGLEAVRVALEDEWVSLLELRVRTSMATGDDRAMPLVRAHALANPFVESAQELLVLALWRRGDHAAALQAYAAARHRLVRELGIEPGPGLRDLQQGILAGEAPPSPLAAVAPRAVAEPALERQQVATADERSADGPARSVVPRELPPAPAVLVGREAELAAVETALLRGRTPDGPGVPVVVAVHGPAGSGTSALALTAAHRVARHFPDGQVYVDLAGHDPRGPGGAVHRVLRSVHGDAGGAGDGHAVAGPDRLVAASTSGRARRTVGGGESCDEAAARLRSALHGRRVLVVLDNAADVPAVVPLLPCGGGSALLVASRPMLATLTGADHVEVGALSQTAAVRLLELASGRTFRDEEHPGAVRVVECCDLLPSAVHIAAARLRSRRDLRVTALARRLADEDRRLDELSYGTVAVRTHLHEVYRQLTAGPDGERDGELYQALGAARGGRVRAVDLALLSGELDVRAVAAGLDRLTDLRLLRASGIEGEYDLPDLVRLHARELRSRRRRRCAARTRGEGQDDARRAAPGGPEAARPGSRAGSGPAGAGVLTHRAERQ